MGAGSAERTFSFVDLAGFSALTEVHGDDHAVAVLDRFAILAAQPMSAGDELIKSIGDAVMFASPDPASAVGLFGRLWRRCRAEQNFPLPRTGAHHGRAIARGGDYFGAAVNLATRVASLAGGGTLLATGTVTDAARAAGLDVVELGHRRFRNMAQPVSVFEILVEPGDDWQTVDPVCRMQVAAGRAAGSLVGGGRRFWFCSLACASAFATNPASYLCDSVLEPVES